MNRFFVRSLILSAVAMAGVIAVGRLAAQRGSRTSVLQATVQPGTITIDYPAEGSIFPPDFTAPTFLWREAAESATVWQIDVVFAGGAPGIKAESQGERMRIGEIDPRCIAPTNQLPQLTPQQAAARTWTPDARTWAAIKKYASEQPAAVSITGFLDKSMSQAVSRGQVSIRISKDPVDAPIFYRDVPLMPSETEKGVIKPLAPAAVPLIAWRLRDTAEPHSRVLMEGLPTCANCHSFSRDGKTLGLDLDGPQNEKGMYAIVPLAPQTSIRNADVVEWTSFRGKLWSNLRVGFMSQVSPTGQYVVNTIEPEMKTIPQPKSAQSNYYVANFKDYRFLQVFYPTRGILAWYSRATGRLQPLPGADDGRYVHTNAVWSPDGAYLVFGRAEAEDPYPADRKPAEYSNDPNETPIQYDLYRIPFNDGRGGIPEPIAGASANGMSNSFPKVSPDGRWIVFVESRNGQLMRPDSRLYIVPAAGGQARPLRANTALMNSWHSFSPNGHWLVFSSKSRSPYTQMYLTHLDEQGNDSPAILVENATAANRAVNIPEFVNIRSGGLRKIDVPAVEFYRRLTRAWEFSEKRQYEAAVSEWKKALEIDPQDAKTYTNLGFALVRLGKLDEAIAQYQKSLELNPKYSEAESNLGIALAARGRPDEAITHYQAALALSPDSPEVHTNLGVALAGKGRLDEAIAHYREALRVNPDYPEVHSNLGVALATAGKLDEAITHFLKFLDVNPNSTEAHSNLGIALSRQGRPNEALAHFELAAQLSGGRDPVTLDTLAAAYAEAARFPEAIETARRALALASQRNDQNLENALKSRIALYEARRR